ncbi:D-3-phosphoglycerate dehydrogenase [Solirubrobacter pauli]|uniref:D-3-phosphoglycerate dehydrogenase n=1 Tax=Solirubrobacter pauli TaxID=166793 RepID=A0A660LFB1_9ACTN|nr:D-isomer specific 2-hydroxyacid dehydrogenase family protein [Solirubrobacter pauli]RKQ92610.1 D-3-phosphoglycerate dehydrogenase [Solirubrobacter pauli]
MPAPAIHIGPEPLAHLVEAVEDGGGRVVALAEAEAIVWAGSEADFPDELPERVRWVQLQSAGIEPWVERIRATPDGVQFTSAVGAYATQVAEHALALLLAGVRGIAGYARAKTWDRHDDPVLDGSTVAIVGAGGIGRELIRLLEPHDVKVLAVTRSGRDGTIPVDRLDEVWEAADHFVIAAPATDGTRHLVGADALARMKPHTWIVNIARGSLIDPDALVEALRAERIGGAALDVTEPEPLPDDHPLWDEPRALITPHVANPQATMDRDLAKRVRENVRRFAAGNALLAPVSRESGY